MGVWAGTTWLLSNHETLPFHPPCWGLAFGGQYWHYEHLCRVGPFGGWGKKAVRKDKKELEPWFYSNRNCNCRAAFLLIKKAVLKISHALLISPTLPPSQDQTLKLGVFTLASFFV